MPNPVYVSLEKEIKLSTNAQILLTKNSSLHQPKLRLMKKKEACTSFVLRPNKMPKKADFISRSANSLLSFAMKYMVVPF